MKKYRLSTLFFLLIPFLILPMGFILPSFPSPGQEVSEYQKRLNELSFQIEEIKAKIKKEESKKSTLLFELEKIGLKKQLLKKEINLLSLQLQEANQGLEGLRKKISDLKSKLEKEKEAIEAILVSLYKFGKFSLIQFMLEAQDMKAFVSESKNLTLLAQHQEKIIKDYKTKVRELELTQEKLETKKNEISSILQDTAQKREELIAEEEKYKTLIQEIEKNRKAYLELLQELKERAEQLQILIQKLINQEISFPFDLVPLYEKKGKLPWPLEGKILTRFGLQKHPRFNTITMNNGIEIFPSTEDFLVKSIHPGKVIFTDYFQGYGKLIIIDHGMTYYSLYGHCSDFLVKKGDFVKTSQPIATIGDYASLKGKSLYFEIRYKTKPLDPLKWLRK